MDKHDPRYAVYLAILREELVPALGCTEPIALAYACAKAKDVLGQIPERLTVHCSGNIIKNVKGVNVPNAGSLKGIRTASILGAICGDSEKLLEVLEDVTPADIERTKALLESGYCEIRVLSGVPNLHIKVEAACGEETSLVEISRSHTNIIRIERSGKTLYAADEVQETTKSADRSQLSFGGIIEFADGVELSDVDALIGSQIECNVRISEDGMRNDYGANVGKSLIKLYGSDVKVRARAKAAAGSDARMGGCTLPVVINSGSGNQGLTVSLPVIEYAEEYGKTREELYRALVLGNLMAIHQKTTIGKLSAYCGAVSAACASGVAIAYLMGENRSVMENTVVNTLGNVAGIVCDGAKPSCAAKIASSVDAAILGYGMAALENHFEPEDGLIKEGIENTIQSYGRLAKQGMLETDRTILDIMLGN